MADPSRPNNRRRNRRNRAVMVVAQEGEINLPAGIPQVQIKDSGASSSGHVTHISPSDYFVEQDMSRRLNLAAMVGRSGSRPSSASHSSTPPAELLPRAPLPQAFLPMLVASGLIKTLLVDRKTRIGCPFANFKNLMLPLLGFLPLCRLPNPEQLFLPCSLGPGIPPR